MVSGFAMVVGRYYSFLLSYCLWRNLSPSGLHCPSPSHFEPLPSNCPDILGTSFSSRFFPFHWFACAPVWYFFNFDLSPISFRFQNPSRFGNRYRQFVQDLQLAHSIGYLFLLFRSLPSNCLTAEAGGAARFFHCGACFCHCDIGFGSKVSAKRKNFMERFFI